MIQTPTVLVLGAGASMPYGFPSGHQLKKKIEKTPSYVYLLPRAAKNALEAQMWNRKCDLFRQALRLSPQPSVDAFLEHRRDHLDLGKRLMAHVLISLENPNSLYPDDPHWYQYLWQQMGTSFDKFHKNKLSVITFNYDRSLEHFLFTALVKSYRLSKEDAAEQLKDIPITHVYGQLGLLEWQANKDEEANVIPYGGKPTAEVPLPAARGIQILAEGEEESEQFRKAHELLIQADRIYFLGFGYNDTNMKRLNLPVLGSSHYDDQRLMAGSCFGLTEAEKVIIGEKYRGLRLPKPYRALEFLRNQESFLRG